MNQSKLGYLILAALIALNASSSLQAQILRQDLCGLDVDFDDQPNATFIVKWTYNIVTRRDEKGGGARPFEGKFFDDRECTWQISVEIERSLYLKGPGNSLWVRESGGTPPRQTFPLKETTTESNCNDSLARFDAEMAEAREKIGAAKTWKQADLDGIRKLVQEFGEVDDIVFSKGFTGCPGR